MGVSTTFGLSFAALGAIGLTAVLIPACSSSQTAGPQDAGTSPSAQYCGSKGATCCAHAGEVPHPECDDGDETQCSPAATACKISDPRCGSTSTCEPFTNNTGAVKSFRMRRLIIVAPPTLANLTVQNVVVNTGVDMAEPSCGEPSTGTGDFSWLLSVDTTKNTLTTGGAPPCDTPNTPSCDPFNNGYCYVNKTVNGIALAPITTTITKAADGTYGTASIPSLNIPIYFGSPISIITLPINNGSMTGIKLSPDGNCIGSLNTKALGPDCSDNYQTCSKWLTDGAMSGFITLEQADKVPISLLKETLCVQLTGDKTGKSVNGILYCPRDASGKITVKGDYCSSPAGAGGCKDASWLAATFAASAVKINDGTGIADCTGGAGPAPDSGTAPADASSE